MPIFALVDSAGAIRRRQAFDAAPALAPEKPLRWLPDMPPAINPRTQACSCVSPVAAEAETIAYAVTFRPDAEIFAQIKAEAQRRINLVAPEWKQRNLTARAVDIALSHPGADYGTLPQPVKAEVAAGRLVWQRIAALRAASDSLEAAWPAMSAAEKAAFDPADDSHWPE